MTNGTDAQFRIDQVQILNWGAFTGLQKMQAGRASTAVLGPSGRGKSTLLDAMASVIMPNPQEFNQAARDDKGHKRERTMYTYARGLTVSHQDEGARSSTPEYLRPAEGGGFVTGAAITWATGQGKRVTALRVAWVASHATDNDAIAGNTVYGFVHADFDLARLDGLTPVRGGASPISPATMDRLIEPGRGDVLSSKQQVVHAAMRSVMQMGRTFESQRLAMQLLRRAQASKGIFSINDLFRDFVLTEPSAMRRWDVTLEHYTEATRLFEEFELARRKAEVLQALPAIAEQYEAAGSDATLKRTLTREDEAGGAPARARVWHATKVLGWASRTLEDLAIERAMAQESVQAATVKVGELERTRARVMDALMGAGEDRTVVLREQLDRADDEREEIQRHREAMAGRLAQFDSTLPQSSGDLALTRTLLQETGRRLADEAARVQDAHEAAVGLRSSLGQTITVKKQELAQVTRLGGNIPPEADQRRRSIAAGSGVPAQRLQYVGELLEIPPTARAWERAIVKIMRPLASDLMVPEGDFAAVRAYVNGHDMRGDVSLVPATAHQAVHQLPAGTVAGMLELTAGPYRGWLSQQLARFTYFCVDSDTDLDGVNAKDIVGRVTRAGMRTAANGRLVKSDSPQRYRWIGRDNSNLLGQLQEEIDGLQRAYDDAHLRLIPARTALEEHQRRRDDLTRLLADLSWPELDLGPVEQRRREIRRELDQVDTPERQALRAAYDDADQALTVARTALSNATGQDVGIELRTGAVMVAEDAAKDLLDACSPMAEHESAALASLPFQDPRLQTVGLDQDNVDARMDAAVNLSYVAALGVLQDQIKAHDARRQTTEQALTAILRSYRNIDDRTRREIDDSIDSLPALRAIHDQLVTDDLPRARTEWLTKVDAELNQALRTVDRQIDVDRRSITTGLDPVNTVLHSVPFRDGSRLQIVAVDRANAELQRFRAIVRRFTQVNPLGQDLFTDEAKVETSFRRLNAELSKLTEASRAGNAWRHSVFDAREHVTFQAIESREDGRPIVHEGVSGMSGGEGQELIAFILGAALRYRLGEGGAALPLYGTVILDEGFVKADSDYTGRSLRALQALGFQLIVGAPREKATAFEDYVDLVAYITNDHANLTAVQIHSLTIQEALAVTEGAA